LEYYKILVEQGKKRSYTKSTHVKVNNILEAMDINKKKRAPLLSITPITEEEYMRGISRKYDRVN